mgnify:CR=1 FL=1
MSDLLASEEQSTGELHPSDPLLLIHWLSRIADDVATEALKAVNLDITPRQVSVLEAVAALELQEDARPHQAVLVKLTHIDRSTLSDIVRRLVSLGLVRRSRCRKDYRAYVVKITDEGREALRTADNALAPSRSKLFERGSAARAVLEELHGIVKARAQ